MEPGHHGTDSPYVLLGVEEDTGFDAIQAAKAKKLASCGDDPQAKARIEAAYDAVLMDRLKQRQAGKVSSCFDPGPRHRDDRPQSPVAPWSSSAG